MDGDPMNNPFDVWQILGDQLIPVCGVIFDGAVAINLYLQDEMTHDYKNSLSIFNSDVILNQMLPE